MSNDRAIEVTETDPPNSDAPWHEDGEPLDPGADTEPTEPLPPVSEEPSAAEQPEPTGPRRWRFVPRSLSSRLVVFVTALVLVVVSATGAATYLALKSFLIDRLSQQVQSTASQPVLPEVALDGGSGQAVRGAQSPWLVVLDQTGAVVARPKPDLGIEYLQLSASQRHRVVTAN